MHALSLHTKHPFTAWILLFLLVIFSKKAEAQYVQLVDSFKTELTKPHSDEELAHILNELSWELAPTNYDEAKGYAEKALQLSQGKYLKEEATAYNRLGDVYDLHGQYKESIIQYEKSAGIRKELADSIGYSNVLINIGASYYYQGIYEKSLSYYMQAARVKEKIGDKKGLAKILNNISLIYRVKNDPDKAIEYINKSLYIKRELHDLPGELSALINLSSFYLSKKNCDQALAYAHLSYSLAIKLNSTADITSSLNNLGFSYKCQGKLQEALAEFKKAEKILDTQNDINTSAYCYKGIGEIYLQQSQAQTALSYLEKASKLAHEAGRTELLEEIYLLRSETNQKLGRSDKALADYIVFADIRDSLFSIEKTRQLNELETSYESEKKEEQIEKLYQDSLLKKEQVQNNRLQRNSFIILSIAILIILVLVLYVLNQKQRSNKSLDSKNKLIEKSLNEKEILLREIHHRVKNNLQIITGLLELQESLHENEKMGSLVSEAQGRIKTMALIHEMLYQNEDLSEINVQKYISRLTEAIENGYSTQKPNKVFSGMENIKFNMDTIIPLGLILNELISNAYKYVYAPGKGNALHISLQKKDDITWELCFADDGSGIPNEGAGDREGSFGLQLVKMLARQLKGKISYKTEAGAKFYLILKELL